MRWAKASFNKYAAFGAFFGAQGISQLIVLAAYPLLGRLYLPEAFGDYALFSSLVVVFNILVFLRLDQALLLEQKEVMLGKIRNACVLAAYLLIPAFCLLFFVISVLYLHEFIYPALLAISFLIYAGGNAAAQLLLMELMRQGKYPQVNRMRLVQGIGLVSLSVFFAFFDWIGGMGLIAALACSQFLMALAVSKEWHIIPWRVSKEDFVITWRAYKDFPLYNLTGAILESISRQIPLWLILYFLSTTEAGKYANAWKVLAMPAALLMPTLGLWLYKKWGQADEPSIIIRSFFSKRLLPFLSLAIFLSFPIMFWSENIFLLIFGKAWSGIGLYAFYLAPLALLLIAGVAVEPIFKKYRQQRWLFFFVLGQTITRVLVITPGFYYLSLSATLLLFVLAEALLHGLVFFKAYLLVKSPPSLNYAI
jgi:O-antigen/teichoic acid export membrane protein